MGKARFLNLGDFRVPFENCENQVRFHHSATLYYVGEPDSHLPLFYCTKYFFILHICLQTTNFNYICVSPVCEVWLRGEQLPCIYLPVNGGQAHHQSRKQDRWHWRQGIKFLLRLVLPWKYYMVWGATV